MTCIKKWVKVTVLVSEQSLFIIPQSGNNKSFVNYQQTRTAGDYFQVVGKSCQQNCFDSSLLSMQQGSPKSVPGHHDFHCWLTATPISDFYIPFMLCEFNAKVTLGCFNITSSLKTLTLFSIVHLLSDCSL